MQGREAKDSARLRATSNISTGVCELGEGVASPAFSPITALMALEGKIPKAKYPERRSRSRSTVSTGVCELGSGSPEQKPVNPITYSPYAPSKFSPSQYATFDPAEADDGFTLQVEEECTIYKYKVNLQPNEPHNSQLTL